MSRRRGDSVPAPLRVAFYTPGFGIGGAERWVIDLAKSFSKAVEVVAFISPDYFGPLACEARRIADIYNKFPNDGTQVDVLIVWGCNELPEIAKQFQGRIIAVSHGEPGLEWTRNTCAAMESVERAEMVAVSAAAAKSWTRPATVIHNGVSLDRCMSRNGRDAVRESLGIPKLGKMALFLGRLSEEKRPEKLLEAAEYLPPEWQVVFAGPDNMGFSEKVCGKDRVRLLPPVEFPGDLLAAADVFVLPSRTEGMPLAVLEAMMADTDIVCSNWAVAAELQEHGCTMITMKEDEDGMDWAQAIKTAYFTPSPKYSAKHYFSAGAMAQRWENYLLSPPPKHAD